MNQEQKHYSEIRIVDAIKQCEAKQIPKFVGFLDEAFCAKAVEVAQKAKANYMLYGGYGDATRQFFGVFPDWCEPRPEHFPIVRLKINNKSSSKLSHRDILGSLMALGIERDTVGDILPLEKTATVFVNESIADFIISQVFKISSSGVVIERDDSVAIQIETKFLEKSETIASNRLDCVIAVLTNTSRGKALEMIESGIVSVDGVETLKPTKFLCEGCKVTVRKLGKFVIDGISDTTKKGRIVLKYRKYL